MLLRLKHWFRKSFQRYFENDLFRRLIKNSGYLSSATTISAALSMLQGILTARLLGVENFGILGTITMFTSVINKLASFRMGELVVKYVGQYTEMEDHQRAAVTFKLALAVEIITSLLAFGLVLLLAPFGATFLAKDPATTGLFMLYGLIVPANFVTESSLGLLQIFDRFRRLAAINVGQSIITLVLIIIAYIMHGGLTQILVAYLLGKVIGAAMLAFVAFMHAFRQWGLSWWRIPFKLIRPKARELAHFAIHTNISATISLITKDSEILWVSFFRSPIEAGYYKLALALANIVQLPVSPMPQATYPELSRQAARKNWGNMRYIMRQGSLLAGGYTIAATVGLIILGPNIIRFIYTPEYLPAYPALLILLAGYFVANTFYWRRGALLAFGHPDFPARVNSILAVIKVALVVLLVPRFGYLMSAALLSCYYITNSFIYVFKIRSLLRTSIKTT